MPTNRTSINRPDLLDVSSGDRLHIGGQVARAGWKVLDVQPGSHVDIVADVRDMSCISDGSFDIVYASHVLEHLGYLQDLPRAVKEIHRIMRPEGKLLASVPDLDMLCRAFASERTTKEHRFHIMRIMFGGQMDPHDFHCVGLNQEFLAEYLYRAGFREMFRVPEFNLFDDASAIRYGNTPISLNMIAIK
jgi:predicted SAM-dependent methyltransferase